MKCTILVPLIFLCAVLAQAQSGKFGLYFEQDGKRYDVVNNGLTLKAAPFELVLYFPEPMGVLLNASLEPFTFGPATRKKNTKKKDDLLGFSQTAMAEAVFNPDKDIIINDNAPSYWYYDSATSHRFSEVIATDSGYLCKRRIEVLSFVADKKQELIEGNMPALYLVFMSVMQGKNQHEIELMRAAVKVDWTH